MQYGNKVGSFGIACCTSSDSWHSQGTVGLKRVFADMMKVRMGMERDKSKSYVQE